MHNPILHMYICFNFGLGLFLNAFFFFLNKQLKGAVFIYFLIYFKL